MTDTREPLYVVCWTHRESPAKSYRFEKAFPRQEAEILAYEENQRFPSFMHWVEIAPVEEPAAAPDPRDALIAQMREALNGLLEAIGGEESTDIWCADARAALAKAGREGTDHDT